MRGQFYASKYNKTNRNNTIMLKSTYNKWRFCSVTAACFTHDLYRQSSSIKGAKVTVRIRAKCSIHQEHCISVKSDVISLSRVHTVQKESIRNVVFQLGVVVLLIRTSLLLTLFTVNRAKHSTA